MKLMCVIAIATLGAACGPGASDSHNSSQAGASPRGGVAEPNRQQPVTLTGCLQNADKPDATATGTTGSTARQRSAGADQLAAGKGSIGERFTLTGAKNESGEGRAAASYILDGNVEALRGAVNRQVRVTGVLNRGTDSPTNRSACASTRWTRSAAPAARPADSSTRSARSASPSIGCPGRARKFRRAAARLISRQSGAQAPPTIYHFLTICGLIRIP